MKIFTNSMEYPIRLHSEEDGLFLAYKGSASSPTFTPDINAVPRQLHGLYKKYVREYPNVAVCLAERDGECGLAIMAKGILGEECPAFSNLIIAGTMLDETISALQMNMDVYLGYNWFPFGYQHDLFVFIPQSEDEESVQYAIWLFANRLSKLLMMRRKDMQSMPMPRSRRELSNDPEFAAFLLEYDSFQCREYRCPDLSGLSLIRRKCPESWVTNNSRLIALDIFYEAVSPKREYPGGGPIGTKPRVFLRPYMGMEVWEVEPSMDQKDGTWYINLPSEGASSLKRLYVTQWAMPMMIMKMNSLANHCGCFSSATTECTCGVIVNDRRNCTHLEQGDGEELPDGTFVGACGSGCPLGYTPDAGDLAQWGVFSWPEAEAYYDEDAGDYASMKDYVVVTDKDTILRLLKNGIRPLNEKLYADGLA